MLPERIFLVGLMGSGKTTVGRMLAKKLGKDFIDSDEEIAKRTGVSIETIFEVEGEAGFRDREQNMIKELAEHPNAVIATGGGAVLRLANRKAMADSGTIIYLEASVDVLYNRTRHDTKRPLLQHKNPKGVLRGLLIKRESLYRGLADKIFHTANNGSVHSVLGQIIRYLKHENS